MRKDLLVIVGIAAIGLAAVLLGAFVLSGESIPEKAEKIVKKIENQNEVIRIIFAEDKNIREEYKEAIANFMRKEYCRNGCPDYVINKPLYDVAPKIYDIVESRLLYASDDAVYEYFKMKMLVAKRFLILKGRGCYGLFSTGDPSLLVEMERDLDPGYRERLRAARLRVLKEGLDKKTRGATKNSDEISERIVRIAERKMGKRFYLFSKKKPPTPELEKNGCDTVFAMYSAALSLPKADTARFVRGLQEEDANKSAPTVE